MNNILTVLLRLKSSHTAKVENNVVKARGKYHHHAGLPFRMSMFIPNKLCQSQNRSSHRRQLYVPLQTEGVEK